MRDRSRSVVIVDDEPAARVALRSVVDGFPALNIVAEVEDGKTAVEVITRTLPDMVFLDIDMPGVDGLEVAKQTRHLSYHLVFVTAHHKYALDAFNTYATDFLLKPARPALIRKCIEKILHQETLALQRLQPHGDGPDSLVLEESGVSRVLRTEHILLIDAIGRYRRIVLSKAGVQTHSQETIVSNASFDDLMKKLESESFLRIHRSVIVNVKKVRALRLRNRRYFAEVDGHPEDLPIARLQVKPLKQLVRDLRSIETPGRNH
ncbi:MAG: LytTR family DNA-binding domain-containing protein [Pseudomonadota bacterium]